MPFPSVCVGPPAFQKPSSSIPFTARLFLVLSLPAVPGLPLCVWQGLVTALSHFVRLSAPFYFCAPPEPSENRLSDMDALDAPGARPDRNHCMPRKELGAALWACLNLVTLHWIVYIFQLDITEEDCFSLFPLETLVYLTPDSEHGMFFMHSLLLALYFVIPGVRICESQPWCIQGEKGVNTACTPLRTQTSLDACVCQATCA